MPTLTQVEKGLFLKLFNRGGYVLNFSKETLNAISTATGISPIYGSKAGYNQFQALSFIKNKLAEGVTELEGVPAEVIDQIENFNFKILGIDLGLVPKDVFAAKDFSLAGILVIAVPVLAALSSLLTSILSQVRQKKANPNMENQQMMGCMMITMPLFSGWIAWTLPVGMGMYWIISSLVAFVQTLILGNIYAPRKTIARDMVEETIYRRSFENNKKAIAGNSEDAE